MKKIIRKITGIILVLTMIAGFASFVYGNESVQDADSGEELVVKVGFVYPKTGDLASFGEYTEEWTKYVVDLANSKGITIDGQKAKISLITADSQSDPKEARKAAKQLIEEKNIDIMITSKTADTTVPV